MNVEITNLTKQFGDLVAVDDVSITIGDSEFVTLVGPSGCGKTTTLRCIAGLEQPTAGSIKFGDDDVTYKSPQERDIAFVFQDYALYPHMTARENISFALEDDGQSEEVIQEKVEDTAEMLGIEEHLDKRPSGLSGGQQQRVALGRSIVRDPDVFLLDEPLSNLDAKLRVQMRAELQEIHQELDTTIIYVTHDQEEAMTMSDRVIILDGGKLQQIAPPEVVYSQPANRFVAGFIGSPSMNFLPCEERNDTIKVNNFALEAPTKASTNATTLGIRPEDISLGHPKNGEATGVVQVFEQVGAFNIVHVELPEANEELLVQVPGSQYFEHDDDVGISIDTDRIHLFDTDENAIHSPRVYSEKREGGIKNT